MLYRCILIFRDDENRGAGHRNLEGYMSRREKENFVLALVFAVLAGAVVISGYVALKRDPWVIKTEYSAKDRADMHGLIKAFVK